MKKKEVCIGRSDINDLVINNPTVSKQHAKLIFESDGTLWIMDLNSSNGTFVNGIKISGKKQLSVADELKLGNAFLDWQNFLLVSESKAESTQQEAYSDKIGEKKANRVGKILLPISLIAFLAFVVFAFTQNFWGIFDGGKTVAKGWKQKKADIVYDISCLRDSSLINTGIGAMSDAKKELSKAEKVNVSVQEETEVGEEVKKQMDDKYRYIKNNHITERVDNICDKLLKQIPNKKFNYRWYILDSDEINAFTAGGKIFITTAMIDFVLNDDELACVLGHEIYHNELGHINEKLRDQKIADKIFGEGFGKIAAVASSLLTVSFNQENEAFCDMYGMDLAVKAGYDGCAAINLWDRMSRKEQKEGDIMKFMRSHPYSTERSGCIHHHIEHNYNKSCRAN